MEAVDAAGHYSYWASKLYNEMMRDADRQVAGILEALAKTKTSSGNCRFYRFALYQNLSQPISFYIMVYAVLQCSLLFSLLLSNPQACSLHCFHNGIQIS